MSDRSALSDGRSSDRRSLGARLRALLSNPTVLTLLLAVLGGVTVFVIATEVFPYHSSNDDEAVYLQQAAMLLEGQLRMTTEFPEAFRPWFFVMEGNELYSKYSPVPAVFFALGLAIGVPRLSLAAVAAVNVLLVSLITAEAFDRRTGALAAAVLVATPFFLLSSSVFLPYPPTTLLNFTFALAYIRALRRRSSTYAALAGTAIGLAFFARPYTAVLFAVPFLVHACWRLLRALRARDGCALRAAIRRYAVIGVFGLLFVGVTLLYNRIMTGSALVFPYQEFASRDGLGFGYREILVYSREYTPQLALIANWQVVSEFATRWTVAAPIGAILAAIGVVVHLRSAGITDRARAFADRAVGRARRALLTSERERELSPDGGSNGRDGRNGREGTLAPTDRDRGSLRRTVRETLRSARRRFEASVRSFGDGSEPSGSSESSGWSESPGSPRTGLADERVRTLLAGLFVSVILGNIYFWGNLNVLAGVYNPEDGLLALYGPFYHFDLLLPLSAFGAFGLLVSVRWLRRFLGARLPAREARVVVLALLLVTVPIGAVAQANALDSPLARHTNNTDQFERAYAPIENRELENALVFVPPIYGDWMNHPLQYLRNDPSLSGDVVYALKRSPGADFTVIENYENRTLYRYNFRGVWGTWNAQPVQPRLRRVAVREGARHRITTSLGVPPAATVATVRIEAGVPPRKEATQYTVSDERLDRLQRANESLDVEWLLNTEHARVAPGPGLRRTLGREAVPLDRSQPVSLEVTFLQPGGGTVTYHYEIAVSAQDGSVRVIWPPRIEVCRLTANCGRTETYIPRLDGYPTGVSVNTTIETTNRAAGPNASASQPELAGSANRSKPSANPGRPDRPDRLGFEATRATGTDTRD